MARRTASDKHRGALAAALKLSHDDYVRRPPKVGSDAELRKYLAETPEPVQAAWLEANKAFKRIEHGVKRHAARRRERPKKNSTGPFLLLVQAYLFPDLLTTPQLTKQRLATIQRWHARLRIQHPHVVGYSDAALKQLIQRARRDARLKK